MKNKKTCPPLFSTQILLRLFRRNKEIAINPSTIPISKPIFTLLIKRPIANPNKMATTPAIFCLVISACRSLFIEMSESGLKSFLFI